MKNKKYIIAPTLAALMLTAFSFSAFADSEEEKNPGERPFMENHQEIEDAISGGDYDTWKALIGEYRPDAEILEVITEENFGELAKAHALMEEARVKMDEAREIFENLGVERPGPGFPGKHFMKKQTQQGQ